MKTIAVDTNVLIDFRLERKPNFPQANRIFQDCVDGKSLIFIPQIVFPEIEWVLRSYYKVKKDRITDFFADLLALEGVVMANKSLIEQALLLFSKTNIKFTDAIILTEIQHFYPDEFLTFDQDLQKLYLKKD